MKFQVEFGQMQLSVNSSKLQTLSVTSLIVTPDLNQFCLQH